MTPAIKKLFTPFALAIAATFLAASVARADDFKIDPVHSFALFDVQHMEAGLVYGTFAGPYGVIKYDPAKISDTSFDVTIDTGTLDTRNDMRDKDLKGPDFFDIREFPQMTFKSTEVKETKEHDRLLVKGNLTIRGVTREVTVDLNVLGTGKGMKGETRTGFKARFTINRDDFGMTADPGVIAKGVEVIIALEAIKQ